MTNYGIKFVITNSNKLQYDKSGLKLFCAIYSAICFCTVLHTVPERNKLLGQCNDHIDFCILVDDVACNL